MTGQMESEHSLLEVGCIAVNSSLTFYFKFIEQRERAYEKNDITCIRCINSGHSGNKQSM